nr:transposase [Streptococcus oralis]
MVIKLYQTGVTTREISDIIERMYGHHYSPSTVSNIAKVTQVSLPFMSVSLNHTILSFILMEHILLYVVELFLKNVFTLL